MGFPRYSIFTAMPLWNVMVGMVQPDILGALDRLARLEPDLEMTGKVLGLASEARDERVEQGLEVDRLQPGELLARPDLRHPADALQRRWR